MRHEEKRLHLLRKIGSQLKSQRETVFREDAGQFAKRLSFFGVDADAQLVARMEAGDPSPSIEAWFCAWQVMQVADSVAAAGKSDAALFLAATQYAPGIEEEMAAELNKDNNPTDPS